MSQHAVVALVVPWHDYYNPGFAHSIDDARVLRVQDADGLAAVVKPGIQGAKLWNGFK